MSETVTSHNSDYTLLEFMDDLLARVLETNSPKQQLTIELPQGHTVTLRVEIVDAELAAEVSGSVH